MGFKVKCVPVMDRMSYFCGSCDLKRGTCIVGWVTLILCVAVLLTGAGRLAKFEDSKYFPSQDTKEILIARVISSAINIPLVAMLLYGAHKEKPRFMLPAVVLDMIGIVILVVALAVHVFDNWLDFYWFPGGFIYLFEVISFVALLAFFWVVTYSYYRKLEEHQYPIPAGSHDEAGT